jgi:hypothetical protein
MITVKTSSLFWKKFPYKAIVQAPWAGYVRYTSHSALDKAEAGGDWVKDRMLFHDTIMAYPKELRKALRFLEKYDKNELRFRCEGRTLSLFFIDRNTLTDIQNEFGPDVVEFHEPASDEALDSLLNHKIMIKDHLIHDCRYKVMLRERLSLLTDSSKTNLVRLLKNNPERYANLKRIVPDLERNSKYLWQTYIYAKESKDLLMLQMIAQPIIREVIKIVTHAEIQEASTADEQ